MQKILGLMLDMLFYTVHFQHVNLKKLKGWSLYLINLPPHTYKTLKIVPIRGKKQHIFITITMSFYIL